MLFELHKQIHGLICSEATLSPQVASRLLSGLLHEHSQVSSVGKLQVRLCSFVQAKLRQSHLCCICIASTLLVYDGGMSGVPLTVLSDDLLELNQVNQSRTSDVNLICELPCDLEGYRVSQDSENPSNFASVNLAGLLCIDKVEDIFYLLRFGSSEPIAHTVHLADPPQVLKAELLAQIGDACILRRISDGTIGWVVAQCSQHLVKFCSTDTVGSISIEVVE
mmetsp:Transcript_10523/g.19070  ORF Transcript_10523/g.19070 Transcript_10523/m.19070 type:complete len:222 (-) Transcript_10523:1540-2205(-)